MLRGDSTHVFWFPVYSVVNHIKTPQRQTSRQQTVYASNTQAQKYLLSLGIAGYADLDRNSTYTSFLRLYLEKKVSGMNDTKSFSFCTSLPYFRL